jgi:tetratricopeptide (TPR) repeat protein
MRWITALVVCLTISAAPTAAPDPDTLMANGHWKRARAVAEAAYKAAPKDARAAYWLGRARHEFNHLDEAQKLLEAAVRLDPKSSPYHRELGELYADQAERASVLRQLGLAHKSRDQFDAALAIAPRDPDNLFDRMLYYLQAPGIAGGDKKKAAELAAEIAKIDAARGYLAQARIARADKQDVESLYRKAVEADPKNFDAGLELAAVAGDREAHARAMLALNPDRIEGYRWLAMALAQQNKVEEAAQVIARAQSAIPDDLSPLVYAARGLLAKSFDLPRAEAWLRKYLAETSEPEPGAPIPAGAHWSLGLVLEKQGRKLDAVRELQEAVRLKPDFEQAKRDLKRMR